MLASYDVKLLLNPSYHPQSNMTERVNRVIKTIIRSYINGNQRDWDLNLSKLGFAFRTADNEVTGFTPAYLNFGRELFLSGKQHAFPSEGTDTGISFADKCKELEKIRKLVSEKLKKASELSAKRYNLRHRPLRLQVGQLVWKRNYLISDACFYK